MNRLAIAAGFLFLAIWYIPGVSTLFGVVLGVGLAIALVSLATPLYVPYLINKPNESSEEGGSESGIHFFTFPEEGKVKWIVRGDVAIRAVLLFAGHCFARVGERNGPDYWEIRSCRNHRTKNPDGSEIVHPDMPEEDPLEGVHWLLKPWARYVYTTTGAVFTGIYPFQKVREYPLERTKMQREEHGGDGGHNIKLEVKTDFSDHFRVREFLYPVRVAAADTRDAISVNILFVIRSRVTNPHRAAFGVDRWEQKLVNLATTSVTNFTRTHDMHDVLTAHDASKVNDLRDAILSIKEDSVAGFEIDGVDIIDVSPNLDSEEKKRLYAAALAKPVAEATRIDGQARADALKALNEATNAGGASAVETQRNEALVRAAKEAKGGATIFVGGTPSGPDNSAAILSTLQGIKEALGKQNGGTT